MMSHNGKVSTRIPEAMRPVLATQSQSFESATPQEIVRWAWQQMGDRLVLSSSFGADAAALLHIVSQEAPAMRVAFLDTGWHFPETLAFRQEVQQRFNLNVVDLVYPGGHEGFRQEHGELWRTSTDACCGHNKVEPWRRFLLDQGVAGWIAGLRRETGGLRGAISILEPTAVGDDAGQPVEFLKIHPLANWTKKEIWAYIFKHSLPYNTLADQGYKSIGCWPCTRAVGAGEDERAGRWVGQDKIECGLHTMTAPVKAIE